MFNNCNRRGLLLETSGSSLVELSLMLPVLLLLFIGAIDFGRAWYVNLEVLSAAEAGALYGSQNSLDLVGMKAAALLDAPDILTLTASPTFGVECLDGSASLPLSSLLSALTCPTSAITYVEVDTSALYTPILRYPSITSPITMTAKVRIRTGY